MGITTDPNDPRVKRGIDEGGGEGMNEVYLVLTEEEREKGFVRPYRTSYKHLECGSITTMGRPIAETYARQPSFYGATFCVACQTHRPLIEFVWTDDGSQVGS